MISAIYFDSHKGTLHPVELAVSDAAIKVLGSDLGKSYDTRATRLGEPFDGAPCVLDFADGSRCEVHDAEAKGALLAALQFKKSFVMRWQDRWLGALAAIVVMLAALFSAWHWGIPWAAERVATYIPIEWEQRLGDEALKGLDKQMFEPTKLNQEDQSQAQAVFQKIRPDATRMPLRLVFRRSDLAGPNAFALPNGTIVVTDAMMYLLAQDDELKGESAERLAGVLAHEIGHVQARHSLKNIVGSSMVGVLSWALFGDFSTVAAGAPALLLRLEYSRAMETEADDYAAGLLRQRNIEPARLAELFELLASDHKRKSGVNLPAWMRPVTDYLSTHPANEERTARLRGKVQARSSSRPAPNSGSD